MLAESAVPFFCFCFVDRLPRALCRGGGPARFRRRSRAVVLFWEIVIGLVLSVLVAWSYQRDARREGDWAANFSLLARREHPPRVSSHARTRSSRHL